MKLNQISLSELRRILRATERAAGPDSVEARIIRRELTRRKNQGRKARRSTGKGDGHA